MRGRPRGVRSRDAVRAAVPAEHLLQASAGGAGSSTALLRESAHGVTQSARTVTPSCAFEAYAGCPPQGVGGLWVSGDQRAVSGLRARVPRRA
jgi:hypothetical protein